MPLVVRVQSGDFDPGAEAQRLEAAGGCGAVVSFVGIVRAAAAGGADALARVTELEIEHYPGMTERALERIAQLAAQRWTLGAVAIVHRVGRLRAGERIVWVGVASEHREAAFDACRFLVDHLKTEAPFWKRESGATAAGVPVARWVEARAGDEAARRAWGGRQT